MRNTIGKFFIKLLVSFGIGAFFLWWIFKNVDFHELKELSAKVDPRLIFLAILCYSSAIAIRVFRWKKLFLPFASLTYWQVARALIVGYAMNIILPARLGELFRVNICKNWYSVPRSAALATVVWERVYDAIIVVSCLMVGAISLSDISNQNEILGLMMGGFSVFSTAIFGVFVLKFLPIANYLQRWPHLQTRVSIFQKGIQEIPSTLLFDVFALSLLIWVFEGLSLWTLVRSTGISLTVFNTALLIGVVSLSTLLPSPPGFIGTMQFAFALSLMAVGYSAASGILAATMNQIFLLGTLTVCGIFLFGCITLNFRKL